MKKILVLFLITLFGISSCKPTLSISENPLSEPEGRIVFYSGRTGSQDIYIMNMDGNDLLQLTSHAGQNQCPSFSPDGKKIIFNSNRDGNDEIYIMDIDGSNQKRLTNTPTNDIQPQISPDGTKIAYTTYQSTAWNDGEIYVMNLDGSNPQQLTTNSNDDTKPVWSSDGTRLLFSSNRAGNYDLYVLELDKLQTLQLTNLETHEIFGVWSPDDNKIAYTEISFSSAGSNIHVMNSDGSEDQKIETEGRNNEDPVWSGDGKTIIFQSNRDGNFEVYRMNVDGTNQIRLTDNSSWDGWPGWGVSIDS